MEIGSGTGEGIGSGIVRVEPRDLGLPFHSWRPYQWEVITQAALSDARVVLIEAPPGIGKTGIGVGVARLLGSTPTHYLTGTKQLQEQYLSIPGVVEVKGRPNFPCQIEPSIMADRAICTVGGGCEYATPGRVDQDCQDCQDRQDHQEDRQHQPCARHDALAGCRYFDQKRQAQRSSEIVWNYAYWLAQMNYAPGGWEKPELLVCDEAHTVRSHLQSFVTLGIRTRTIQDLGLHQLHWHGQGLHQDTPFDRWQEWCREFSAHPRLDYEIQRLRHAPPATGDHERVRWAHAVRAISQACATLSQSESDWVVTETWWGVEFRPVWSDQLIIPYLLRHVRPRGKVIFLSATILSGGVFTRLHGLTDIPVEYIRTPSYFSPDRRPIHYRPVGKISKGADLQALRVSVQEILQLHPGERGLIHTVSYHLAQEIMALGDPRLVTHKREDRALILKRFKETPGAVLVSPSMTTGVDLPYDLCRFQVISKLPFPDLGDRQIKAQMRQVVCPGCEGQGGDLGTGKRCRPCKGTGVVTERRGQEAYTYDTVTTLVQAYGRGMRAEDDACVTYLLDENWKWFRPSARELIPQWFNEALIYPVEKSGGDIIRDMIGKIRGEIDCMMGVKEGKGE